MALGIEMVDINDFDDVFNINSDASLDQSDFEEIQNNRRTLGGELFFDKLLRVLHVKGLIIQRFMLVALTIF